MRRALLQCEVYGSYVLRALSISIGSAKVMWEVWSTSYKPRFGVVAKSESEYFFFVRAVIYYILDFCDINAFKSGPNTNIWEIRPP